VRSSSGGNADAGKAADDQGKDRQLLRGEDARRSRLEADEAKEWTQQLATERRGSGCRR
jgi:hypothetical protein